MKTEKGSVNSPGRVNLLGEHVDYNDGLVLPAAIERSITIHFSRRNDSIIKLHATDYGQSCEISLFDLDSKIDNTGEPLPDWAYYPAGVVWILQQRGYDVQGFEASYHSDIPIGAGLSSSAAVEVGFAVACQALGGWEMDRPTLARFCQQAEIHYVGVKCGLMDQFACANGVKDHAILLDTRSLEAKPVPLPKDTTLVIADSMIRRSLRNSAYNERRKDCEAAVAFFHSLNPTVKALRDVSPAMLHSHADQLPPQVFRHARHVVEEIERVNQAIVFLEEGDAKKFGELMFATHRSLRDNYEVSCPELDTLVELAGGIEGCLGARLTGAGFGGCTVNLVEEDQADAFIKKLQAGYQQKTGLQAQVFQTRACQGAHLLTQ